MIFIKSSNPRYNYFADYQECEASTDLSETFGLALLTQYATMTVTMKSSSHDDFPKDQDIPSCSANISILSWEHSS